MFSPSSYNAVGLGTTQLYNQTWVYNPKRHGVFRLGKSAVRFQGVIPLSKEADSRVLLRRPTQQLGRPGRSPGCGSLSGSQQALILRFGSPASSLRKQRRNGYAQTIPGVDRWLNPFTSNTTSDNYSRLLPTIEASPPCW